MASLDSGVPVLAYRIVGPSRCWIITGYDEDGPTVTPWSVIPSVVRQALADLPVQFIKQFFQRSMMFP